MIVSLAAMPTGTMFEILLANLIVVVAGFVQASAGIGFAMIAVPLLVLIDPTYAPGPSLFVMLFLSLAMVAKARRHIDKNGLATLLPGLCVGTVAGALLLGALSPSSFGLAFGGIVLTAIVLGQFGFAPRQSRTASGVGGFCAGLMGTLSGIHGPPLAVLYQRAEPARAHATIALIFVIGSVLSLASLYAENLFGKLEFLLGLSLIPGLIAGYVLARLCRGLISDRMARNLMLVIAATSSVVLIAKSVI